MRQVLPQTLCSRKIVFFIVTSDQTASRSVVLLSVVAGSADTDQAKDWICSDVYRVQHSAVVVAVAAVPVDTASKDAYLWQCDQAVGSF